ncbi:hypothetical protein Tco_0929573 [Tanacetum coccineum]
MQEFWATATVHHHSIRFKMNNKKHIVNLEYFREMLQICPKLPNQQFEELPFEEAILTFLRDIGHSGAEPPKTKASVKKKQVGSDKMKTPPKGKRLKTSAKTAKPAKKKQHAKTSMDKGLAVLSEVALTEVEQLKLVIKRKDNDDEVNVSEDDDTDNDDDDNDDVVDKDINDDDANNQDKDDQDAKNPDDDNEQTDSDNNGDDFVYPKFSTYDEEEREEESFDPRVQTPSHIESTNDEEVQGMNIEGKEMDEKANNEESERNELYRDLNVNLEGRDVEMTDAQPTNVQTTQVIEDTQVIITLVIP